MRRRGIAWSDPEPCSTSYAVDRTMTTSYALVPNLPLFMLCRLGAGYSTSRNRGEIVSNAYACLPRYDNC
jgi:hypothetical protein